MVGKGERMRWNWELGWGRDTERKDSGSKASLKLQHYFACSSHPPQSISSLLGKPDSTMFYIWKTFNKDGVRKPGSEAPG